MTPLQELAIELKAAAVKYCEATGKSFSADFNFVSSSTFGKPTTKWFVASVDVSTTEEASE